MSDLREALAKYLSDNFGEHPVRSMIPWRTEADALLTGPLAPLLARACADCSRVYTCYRHAQDGTR